MTAFQRKAIAIAMLLMAVAVVYLLMVRPVLDTLAEQRDRRELLTLQYQRGERLVASIPRMRHIIEMQAPQQAQFVITARSDAAARDYLQERLRDTLAKLGADLSSAEAVDSPPGSVAISATTKLAMPQLLQLMSRMENEKPYVLLNGLNIAANDALVSGRLDPVDVKIDLSIPYTPAAQH